MELSPEQEFELQKVRLQDFSLFQEKEKKAISCGNCIYYNNYMCCRYPQWLHVSPDHWCGEWTGELEEEEGDASRN